MGTLRNFRFPSQDSYNVVASKGKRLRLGFLSLKIMPAPDTCNRFCFVVKKKSGNAVFRNKCRRILRSVLFKEAKNFKSPVWIMALVEMRQADVNWEALREDAGKLVVELC